MRRPELPEIDLVTFEHLVLKPIGGIPEPFAGHLQGVVVQVQEQAKPETHEAFGLARDEELLGLYSGRPFGEASFS